MSFGECGKTAVRGALALAAGQHLHPVLPRGTGEYAVRARQASCLVVRL